LNSQKKEERKSITKNKPDKQTDFKTNSRIPKVRITYFAIKLLWKFVSTVQILTQKMIGGCLVLGLHVFIYLASIIISFILLLPGTPGSSLRSTMYLARLELSPTLINGRSTGDTLYSNPSADIFWIYPTSYCAQVPVNQNSDQNNKHFEILCSNYSATYKFNFYDQFPLASNACTKDKFSKINRQSTNLSNVLLAFPIVNSLWIFWILLFLLLRWDALNVLFIANSITRFILIVLIAVYFVKPQKELAKISELCYDNQLQVFGPTKAYKGLVYFLLVLISLEGTVVYSFTTDD
jgi:hypothetical protein